MNSDIEERIQGFLANRKEKDLFRSLSTNDQLVDFSSNDYLGFSRSAWIKNRTTQLIDSKEDVALGSTGSRLLNGNSVIVEELESMIAKYFVNSESALLFSSGFDANSGLISTICRPGDQIIYDELVHASIHQGIKLSGALTSSFKHNDIEDLKLIGKETSGSVFLFVESLYSMNGDIAPLKEIAKICSERNWNLIVDEAHAFGLYEKGLCSELNIVDRCFARVFTFGKALGVSGACVIGSQILKNYLINFCKNFIYSTAMTPVNILQIRGAFEFLQKTKGPANKLRKNIEYFKFCCAEKGINDIRGEGPIFWLKLGDNSRTRSFAKSLEEQGFDIRPILSPTVPVGTERLRIILHSFNTNEEIFNLTELLKESKQYV